MFLTYSDLNGIENSWSNPVRVNDDNTHRSQFLPRLALDRDTGFVGVAWYDTREDSQNLAAKVYATVSRDGGQSFMTNIAVSDGSSSQNKSLADPTRDYNMAFGDYIGVAFVGQSLFVAWGGIGNGGTFDVFFDRAVVGSPKKQRITVDSFIPADPSEIFIQTTGDRFLQIYDSLDTDRVPSFTATTSAVEVVDVYGTNFGDKLYAWGILRDEDNYAVPVKFHGGAGHDIATGGAGDDTLFGDGDDPIATDPDLSADGADMLDGGDGDDLIYGGEENDAINGGEGDDTIYADYDQVLSTDTVTMEGNDLVMGDAGDDLIFGDSLRVPWVGSCKDSLYGGDGNDTIYGEHGEGLFDEGDSGDWIEGNDGDDYLEGDAGDNTIHGGAGRDTILGDDGGGGADQLFGDDGDDVIDGGEALVNGGGGNDAITLRSGSARPVGGDGDDTIIWYLDPDYNGIPTQLFAGAGNDVLQIHGTDGDDTISISGSWISAEWLNGSWGLDCSDVEEMRLYTGTGADVIGISGGAVKLYATELSPSSELYLSGGSTTLVQSLANAGTITLAGGALVLGYGVTLTNTGTLDIAADGTIASPVSGSALIVNTGTIVKRDSTGTSTLPDSIGLNASGTIDVQSGTIELQGSRNVLVGQTLAKTGAGTLSIPGLFGVYGMFTHDGGTLSTGSIGLVGTYHLLCGTHTTQDTSTTLGAVGSEATLILEGGTFNANILVAGSAAGRAPVRIQQSGGAVNVLNLYMLDGSDYQMTGGTLHATGYLVVGDAGAQDSVFNQTGGTVVTDDFQLIIGRNGGHGEYTNTGGTLNLASLQIGDGAGSVGVFTQTAGTTACGGLVVGRNGGEGTINLSGGSFDEEGWAYVGVRGTGTVSVAGGSFETNLLILGDNTNGTGAASGLLDYSGGTMSLPGGTLVGYNGSTGEVRLRNGVTLTNSATFDIACDGAVVTAGAGGGTFINNGTIQKSAGSGTASFDPAIVFNPGTGNFNLQSGNLVLPGLALSLNGTDVLVSWGVPGTYTVLRSVDGVNYTTLANNVTLPYTDTTAQAGQTYWYRLTGAQGVVSYAGMMEC